MQNNCEFSLMYKGEDVPIDIDLGTDVFTDLQDVFVGFIIGKNLVKTWKKSESTPELQVLPVTDEPNMCKVLCFREETNEWAVGLITLEITLVYIDTDFPDGRHDIESFPVGELLESKTGDEE